MADATSLDVEPGDAQFLAVDSPRNLRILEEQDWHRIWSLPSFLRGLSVTPFAAYYSIPEDVLGDCETCT